jgi:demethoxyubiquinone hydroxylase (CLK1/Coq7/Cat5 family)
MSLPNIDRIVLSFDRALRTVSAQAKSSRPYPAATVTTEDALSEQEKTQRRSDAGQSCRGNLRAGAV